MFLPAGFLLHYKSEHSLFYFYDVPAHEGELSDAELSEDDELPEKEELSQYVAMSKKENLFEEKLMEERMVQEVLPGKLLLLQLQYSSPMQSLFQRTREKKT